MAFKLLFAITLINATGDRIVKNSVYKSDLPMSKPQLLIAYHLIAV